MKPYLFFQNITLFLIFLKAIKDIGNIMGAFDKLNLFYD